MLRRMAIAIAALAMVAVQAVPVAASAQASARDPLTWPFPWDSIWNMPIGSGAVYVDAQIEPGRQYGVFADEDILILESDAPLVDVLVHDADWDPARQRCSSIVSPRQVQISGVPVPAWFSTEIDNDGTPNASAAVLMRDGETVVQTQPLHVCGPGGPVVSQYRFPDDNLRTGDGIAGAHGGASMSSIGGTIRVGELTPGATINHALKVIIDSRQYTFYDSSDPTPGYRWPAGSADFGAEFGYGGSVPEVEMGSLLALPPDFDVGVLRTEPARIIAQAMMDYGGYVVDSAGWDAHYFATEFGPNGRVIDEFESNWGWPYLSPQTATCANTSDPACAWSTDMGDIFAGLHVVANNGPTAVGGPGSRRAPCAPAFSDGTGGAPVGCSPVCAGDDFADVPDRAYFSDAVAWAACNGVTTGTSDRIFSPGALVTRAELATFLWRYAQEPTGFSHSFRDVSSPSFYEDAVAWMAATELTVGTTDSTFNPDAPVTRAELATFLWRYAQEPTGFSHSFSDVARSSFYEDAVAWMAATEITVGTSDTTFGPSDAVTRAQAVTFLWRYNNQQ